MHGPWDVDGAGRGAGHTRLTRGRPVLSTLLFTTAGLALLAVAGCESNEAERRAPSRLVSIGPNPILPKPQKSLIPTVHIAPAKGWPDGTTPVAAPGLVVSAFATGLDHPRWLHVLPNGDVLVAETNAPPRPEYATGFKGAVMKQVMEKAGAATPSANRITLLRDADGDGIAELKTPLLEGLNSPFGMALVGDTLYVANTDAVWRFAYEEGTTEITAPGEKVADLPAGPINQHWTKTLLANHDGSRLYVTVGSASNIAEHGLEHEERRAAILEIDPATGDSRVFASGLRNPVGLAWEPHTGILWTAVNERDELGDNVPPDYLTSVRDGGFYGWPYSYFGPNVDQRVKPQRPDLVATALVPDYAMGAHTACLGLAFYSSDAIPRFASGALVGQHGSWNRKPRSGYKVVFVRFEEGKPTGPPEDVLTGFLDDEGNARGRPVGVVVDTQGAVLVADDVGNVVWRITPETPEITLPAATTTASR